MGRVAKHRCTLAAFMLAALLALAPSGAGATWFEVYPLLIQTTTGLGAVTVHNPGPGRLYIEARLRGWSASPQGLPVLAPVKGALVSPPGTWIAPGQNYRFRLAVPRASAGREGNFRLLLRQLPSRRDLAAGHVVFTITQSIPVFAEPPTLSAPRLSATVAADGTLLIRNDGGRRARISHLAQGGVVLVPGLAGYALGHATLAIRQVHAHPGAVTFQTDLGPRTLAATAK